MSEPEVKKKDSIHSGSSLSLDKGGRLKIQIIIWEEGRSRDQEVLDLQKKLKVLKDALLKERSEKDNLSKKQSSLIEEITQLKNQLQEKVK